MLLFQLQLCSKAEWPSAGLSFPTCEMGVHPGRPTTHTSVRIEQDHLQSRGFLQLKVPCECAMCLSLSTDKHALKNVFFSCFWFQLLHPCEPHRGLSTPAERMEIYGLPLPKLRRKPSPPTTGLPALALTHSYVTLAKEATSLGFSFLTSK